ncbi:MAG TPA: proton-conducting transporter membrane subunit [Nitrospiria bacterium]|jgi:NADH-quinone oxidoreductase subunit L|nr:proton-conducting transporter membrane subunit [Nitrospiria bacterium]
MLHDYPLLILLAPLAAALPTAFPSAWIGRRAYGIGVLAHVLAFGLAVWVLREVGTPGHDPFRIFLFPSPWSRLVNFELSIDRLAAVMMVLITGIGALIYLYSVRYMQSERGRGWFHTLLALAVFVLLCMVSSANLLMLFVFWQLLSWILSLLAYNYSHTPTAQGAFRTFTMLRLGDVAFLAGIVLAYGLYGTLDFDPLFSRAAGDPMLLSLFGPESGIEVGGPTVVALLIFVGAMSKSAQFPLHMWLPDSLYAPTPVHALLHAGIINAGGFLLNRLAPLYGLSPAVLHAVFVVGLLTALLGASMMLTQNDIKKTLGYSTIGQMGYMIMECGLGAFALAVFHLIAHGLFKATIFLHCGNVIHAARLDPRFPPKIETSEPPDFSLLTWLTGFTTTLILPLIILLAAHGVLNITFRDSQGVVIFLFFSWVTSSQAILTLYRFRAVASRKVAALMLLTLLLVVSTYLLAAEAFTYFLYPAPGRVSAYFQAAALPGGLFDAVILATALFVILGWTLIYARSHGRSIRLPEWVGELHVRFYLFCMNRLYMDALLLRLGRRFARAARWTERSRLFAPVLSLIALGLVWPALGRAADLPAPTLAILAASALLLPLFPFHGVYVTALTRLPGYGPVLVALLLPAAGFYGLVHLLPDLPPELLGNVSRLALIGALYGTFRALMQDRPKRLTAYAGLVFYSVLWWHLAAARSPTPQAGVYAGSAALLTGGLFFAFNRLEARYGDLGADPGIGRMGGLALPMPRFATMLGFLVMATVGLPPFGLFSGFIGMLLNPPVTRLIETPGALLVILLAWFGASWYLFRMMQRLLFGPHRPEILYEDLRPTEVASFMIVLALLIGLGLAPHGSLDASFLADGYRTAMEWSRWNP